MKSMIFSAVFLIGLAATGCSASPNEEFASDDSQPDLGTRSEALTAQSIPNDVMLVNAKTGKCLTIAGGVSTDNNVTALQFNCDTDESRRWTLRLKL